jgi:hypothetical protein
MGVWVGIRSRPSTRAAFGSLECGCAKEAQEFRASGGTMQSRKTVYGVGVAASLSGTAGLVDDAARIGAGSVAAGQV